MSRVTPWRLRALALPLLGALLAATPAWAEGGFARRGFDPEPARWPTWIIRSGAELRLPPPPDAATTAVEAAELAALATTRDAGMLARIRHWDVGGPAYRWNEIAVAEAVARGLPAPLFGRHLALLNAAIHDSVIASWDSKAAHRRQRPATAMPGLATALPTPASPSYPAEHAAAAAAAAEVLTYLFPEKRERWRALAEEAAGSRIAAGLHYRSDVDAGLMLGAEIGRRAAARGREDGSTARWSGTVPQGPGLWRGTAPALPMVASWRTWVLARPDEVRPAPPPAHDGPMLADEIAELRALQPTGPMNGAALYWEAAAGGLRSPAFWNGVTARKVLEYGLAANPPESVRAFALVSVTFHDATVACWEAKYHYWMIRPSQLDAEIKPLFTPPAHPSYPSAHSCLSAGAGGMLARLFPADAAEFAAMVKEAGVSRLWARIHYRSDVVAGEAIGAAVTERVVAKAGLRQ
jgi:membrane-associated phospholipid phosphatase